MSPKKAAPRRKPAPPAPAPAVVVKPVPDKIGEPRGNLASRAAAFKRRRG